MDVAGSYTFHRAVVPNLGCTVENIFKSQYPNCIQLSTSGR